MAYCPSDLPATNGGFDQTTLALVRMYQLYGACAGSKADLIDYLEGRKK